MARRKWFFKLLKRGFALLGLVVLGLAAVLLFNTFNFKSSQTEVPNIDKIEVPDAAVDHLAQAVQIQTISFEDSSQMDSSAFQAFKQFLISTYPLADSLLHRKSINEFAHLYEWQGSDPARKPVLLLAHTDVVPVDEKDLPEWKQDPFGGAIVDGVVWGRGTMDDKGSVIGILEAVELLLKQGFQPKQTIFLAFGHDEEVRGRNGAPAIVQHLKQRGIQLEMVLDEGFFVTQGLVPDMEKDVAFIGVAEKGYVSFELSIHLEGGHSSIPNSETALAVLSQAIARIQENPLPPRITEPMRGFVENIGPEMPFTTKMAFANTWLFKSMILSIYEQKASSNAMVRTTITPTIVHGGTKDNVIPQFASATFNSRTLPGDDIATVENHIREAINDERIDLKIMAGNTASRVSNADSRSFKAISTTIKEIFPDVLTSPNLVVGATDGYFFEEVSDDVYRFLPMYIHEENLHALHGINEYIPVEEFKDAIRFYVRLMENLNGE